jgi:hypothetical protein
MRPVNGDGWSDRLYWAVSASPRAAQCHVLGPSLSPSRFGDLIGYYGGPRGRPGPRRVIPDASSTLGARTARGAKAIEEKRPEAQGGRTPRLLRLLTTAAPPALSASGPLHLIERHCAAESKMQCRLHSNYPCKLNVWPHQHYAVTQSHATDPPPMPEERIDAI